MKKLAVVVVALLAGAASSQVAGYYLAFHQAKPSEVSAYARQAVEAFVNARIQTTNATLATQAATEANVALQYALVKQNEEMIRLLKKLANEK